ncbi:HTH-type transcriptional activator IlvY [Ferrimonas marina]|uniref:LysR family transcriptional regulator, positive regulator for ilvC n=1 Tax=Ferrimonas marina TaxID=299255 RepID=A0A1M5Z9E3_9GAMM|nr:HTH-type transcriptional activator IlvY [Ferrimonas marina]SHI20840.1 LysR family transcriptional regulator, positive regulator for ilvC [Ferrimonas marina]
MDIRTLTLFQHLATSLHFGQTAQANHVSPSGLSRAIQRLEQELGTPLLLRDNRHVSLTPAGEQLLHYANDQLTQWHQLKRSLTQQAQQLSGTVRIYCSVTAAYSHLPQLLDPFRQRHPEVEIQLTTGDAASALARLQAQEADVAIAASDGQFAKPFAFQILDWVPVAVIGPKLPCQVQRQLAQSEVDWGAIPLILPEHGQTRRRLETWYRHKQVGKPKIYATVGGHEALLSMVALGCGVGIAPQVVIDNSPVKSRLLTLSEEGEVPTFNLGVGCLAQRREEPLIKAFMAVTAAP